MSVNRASIAEQKKNGTAGKFGAKTSTAPIGGLAPAGGGALAEFDRALSVRDFDAAERLAPLAISERAREIDPLAKHVDFELVHTDEGSFLTPTKVIRSGVVWKDFAGPDYTVSPEDTDLDIEPLARIPFSLSGDGHDGTEIPGMRHMDGDRYRFDVLAEEKPKPSRVQKLARGLRVPQHLTDQFATAETFADVDRVWLDLGRQGASPYEVEWAVLQRGAELRDSGAPTTPTDLDERHPLAEAQNEAELEVLYRMEYDEPRPADQSELLLDAYKRRLAELRRARG